MSRLAYQQAEALQQAFNAFMGNCRKISAEQAEQKGVCGEWSVKNIAAHLAGWDWEAAQRFQAFRAGTTEDITYDVDRFNARSVAERQPLSWAETLQDLQAAQAALQAEATQLSPADLDRESRFGEWLEGRTADYQFHTGQLAALEQRI